MNGTRLSTSFGALLILGASSAWAEPAEQPPAGQSTQPVGATEASAETSGAVVADEVAPTKDWRIGATVGQSLGIGAFVQDENARNVQYGYSVSLSGSYKFWDKLSVFGRVDFDQLLIDGRGVAGTKSREFFFRETRLGVSGANLYEIPVVGIGISANTSLRLPTDKAAQAAGRVLGWTLGTSFSKTFDDLGPGALSLSYSAGFRYNFGKLSPEISADAAIAASRICRTSGADFDGCATSIANTVYSFSNSFAVEYVFFDDFSFGVSIAIANSFKANLSASDASAIEDRLGRPVGQSINSRDGGRQIDTVFGTIEFGYTATDFMTVALGTTTVSNPFINKDGEQYTVRFPFWDTETPADNLTNLYLDLRFSY